MTTANKIILNKYYNIPEADSIAAMQTQLITDWIDGNAILTSKHKHNINISKQIYIALHPLPDEIS